MLKSFTGNYRAASLFQFQYIQAVGTSKAFENGTMKWFMTHILPAFISKTADELGYADMDCVPFSNFLFNFIVEHQGLCNESGEFTFAHWQYFIEFSKSDKLRDHEDTQEWEFQASPDEKD